MSDIDSPGSSPIRLPSRPSKRRRVYDSEASTPRSSSPDGKNGTSPRKGRHSARRDTPPPRSITPSDFDNDRSRSPDELRRSFYEDEDVRSDGSRRRSSTPGSVHSSAVSERSRRKSLSQPLKLKEVRYKLNQILEGHQRGVSQVKFSPDGNWIASCSADATIKIWEVETGELVHTLDGHLAGISTIAWSSDSQTIASGSDDKVIRLWDRVSGQPYPDRLLGHHNYVYSIAFSPKGNILASGSYDEAVFLWDVRSSHQMRSLPAHSDPVGGVDFVRDGTLVVSCSGDGLIRIWDTGTGQCLRTLVHEDNAPVVSVQFTPNGKYVLAWTQDSCVRLWDYREGLCKKTYQGHEIKKYSIGGTTGVYGKEAFVASGSEDGSILLWDATSKNILQKLEAHDGVTLWVDSHPYLDLLVSCGLDNKVKIWSNEDQEEEEEIKDGIEERVKNGMEEETKDGTEGETKDGMEEEIKDDMEGVKQEYDDTPMRHSPLESPEMIDEDP